MKEFLLNLIAISVVLFISNCSKLPKQPVKEIQSVDGEKLVRQLWSDFKRNNREVFENWIADGFQSVHQDGSRNKAEQITLLMNLNLGDYTLSNFKTTQNENVVIVSYTVSVHEMIDGNALPTAPAQRLSIFQKIDNDWKWIAHANLNPMNK